MIRLLSINDRRTYSRSRLKYLYSCLFHEEVTHSGRIRCSPFGNLYTYGKHFGFE
jgi:hypothetical protein